MRPLLISTYDNLGGAACSALRLHQGLHSIGVQSKMLVQGKFSNDENVMATYPFFENFFIKGRTKFDSIPLGLYPERKKVLFSPGITPFFPTSRVNAFNPDVINLHWVCGGFIRPETLQSFLKPVIWTLHDMWAFTGGCHYDEECGQYKESCGHCPVLDSQKTNDLSKALWKRKEKSWADLKFKIVTPSRWLGKAAKESQLFRDRQVEVIPYGIDVNLFKPIDKIKVRKELGLPLDKKLILFVSYGTDDTRKGIRFLKPVLEKIISSGKGQDIELLVVGSSDVQGKFGCPTHNLGLIKNDRDLAGIYSAADVFLAPSTQDNLPNTVLEALACGVPCVAFDIGGLPDMIHHEVNGYIARAFEIEDLSRGIQWAIGDKERWTSLSRAARDGAVRDFPLELQARRYQKLYEGTGNT